MNEGSYLFTSESVTEGHPDKVADQISDGILDAYLAQDPYARVACETLVATNRVVLAGEITSGTEVDRELIVREVVRKIGYDRPDEGFSYQNLAVEDLIHEQAREIGDGVDKGGAGDQGLMFGFACDETPELMPLSIMLAHGLTRRLAEARKTVEIPWLRPDGKAQVTVRYEAGIPREVTAVVVSCQHETDIGLDEVRGVVLEKVIGPVIPERIRSPEIVCHINPCGTFIQGGPAADSGLTGRKIIVDTYGGAAPHGGGAFSGKDPTKVDRSAAYMARHIAKSIVASSIAQRALVQIAYAIGVADPVSVYVDAEGSAASRHTDLESSVRQTFPLSPLGIIEYLNLRRPIYFPTAVYGHFGREEGYFPWEEVAALR
jgi:S-adenosylmethionine synthetase